MEKWSWVYFGTQVERHLELKTGLLSGCSPIESGVLINQIAADIRHDFINLDRHVETDVGSLAWLTSYTAEKNPFGSSLFYNCCAYLAFDQVIRTINSHLLVVVEDGFLGRKMIGLAQSCGMEARLLSQSPFTDRCPLALYQFATRAKSCARAIKSRIKFVRSHVVKRRALRKLASAPWKALKEIQVLLVSWTDTKTFAADKGGRPNPYFGQLPSFLQAKTIRFGHLANPADWVDPFPHIAQNTRQAKDPACLVEDCLPILTVLRVAIRSISVQHKLSQPFVLNGHDLSEFLREAFRREWCVAQQCRPWLYTYIPRHLSSHGIRPHAVFFTMENQPWEKALRFGFRQFLPDTRVIGFQHTPFSQFWLPYFPSDSDLNHQQIPDSVITIGSYWTNTLTSAGYPEDVVHTGIALRHGHLWDNPNSTSRINTENQKTHNILVACSIGFQDSLELVYKSLMAFSPDATKQVVIKFHPKMGGGADLLINKAMVVTGLTRLPQHFHISSDPMSSLLNWSSIVMYNSSSVAFEALARGIPVVFVQSDIWFDLDPVPEGFPMSHHVRTPDELRYSIETSDRHDPLSPDTPRLDMRDVLAPLNEDKMQELCSCLAGAHLNKPGSAL